MARIRINDIESASLASESYLNDLQEVEMTSVKGGWGWIIWVAVAIRAAILGQALTQESPSQPGPEQKSITDYSGWDYSYSDNSGGNNTF